MSLFDLFRRGARSEDPSSPETATVRKIIQALDQLEPARAKFLAAFAYLLSRAARADLEISPEETGVMERIVSRQGGLPDEQAAFVIQLAKTQNILFGATENYLVTREFNAIATHEEKMHLLDCIYAVAAADGSVSTVEDNEISQIADELRIEHPDFISVRTRYRGQLAVLQDGGQND
ncbi:MAG: TerB family tellurite resistance protein [Acidobacteria bacterium]|nr:TerB family tellurite resistance protein [Acidobacteriota bacterium]